MHPLVGAVLYAANVCVRSTRRSPGGLSGWLQQNEPVVNRTASQPANTMQAIWTGDAKHNKHTHTNTLTEQNDIETHKFPRTESHIAMWWS